MEYDIGTFYYIATVQMLCQRVATVNLADDMLVHVFTCPDYSCYETQVASEFSVLPENGFEWDELYDDIISRNKGFYYIDTYIFKSQCMDVMTPIHFDNNYDNGEAWGLIKSINFFDYYSSISIGPSRWRKALEVCHMHPLMLTRKSIGFEGDGYLASVLRNIISIKRNQKAPFRRHW